MRAISAVPQFRLRSIPFMVCTALVAIAANAQTGLPVFPSSVYVRPSTNGASNATPFTVGTSTLNLSCPATGTIATVSSTTNGTGNVLMDNYINVTVTQGSTTTGPTNICRGGVSESGYQDCFTTGYQTPAGNGQLNGDDPNGAIAFNGGVAPIDISDMLAGGANTVKFDEVDTGGYLAAASVYLYTNCTSNGVSGGGTIGGNPVTSTTLTQPFTFSGSTGKVVSLVFDLSTANNAGTLSIPPGSTPTTTDQAIDPATFPSLVAGTSFATSQCLIHLGELYNGNPACKLYTLTCTLGQGSESSGPQCPSSSSRNVVIQDVFDFPPLYLPDIPHYDGNLYEPFHQGFGFIEPSDTWLASGGGPCSFDENSGIIFSCPQNLQTQFTGPGLGRNTGTSQPVIQSSFISIGPVPLYRTHVDLVPYSANYTWVNSHDITAKFMTTSPVLPPDFNGGNLNGFVAASPYSLTYGISTPQGLPSTEFPVPTDTTVLYPGGCPTPGTPAPATWKLAPVTLHVDSDGKYLLHYFATDCAGTEELHYEQGPSGAWKTLFYNSLMYVDTVKPTVVAGPTLACGSGQSCIIGQEQYEGATITIYKKNSVVKATSQCADDFSGVALCAAQNYSSPITNPGPVSFSVNTSTVGYHSYTTHVTDAAGNQNKSAVLWYAVQ